jgi:hypothetical protein
MCPSSLAQNVSQQWYLAVSFRLPTWTEKS